MNGRYVVCLRGDVFGPFDDREQADDWAVHYGMTTVKHLQEIVTWDVWTLREPPLPERAAL